MKRCIILMCLVLMLLLCACGNDTPVTEPVQTLEPTASVEPAAPTETEAPAVEATESVAEADQTFSLYYGEDPLEDAIACLGNRPYVSLSALEQMSAELHPGRETRCFPELLLEDKQYIALADAAWQYDLGAVFQGSDKSVHLYHKEKTAWDDRSAAGGEGVGLIRLEDIMADNGINYRFTHDKLVKLRVISEYLGSRAQNYYVAWIPMYVNPKENVRNDISRDYNFYNTDFVFSLDYMVCTGGLLGLHGYTHQSGDTVSASGNEFGDENPYTQEEILERFRAAEEICSRLGYSYHFFEFSHYHANEFQKQVAEQYFDVVYQERDTDGPGLIRPVTTGDHTCLWVPTPSNYVDGLDDRDGILERLERDKSHGKAVSLFFHPSVDYTCVEAVVSEHSIRYQYDEQTGALPAILDLLDSWGYCFGKIPANP